MKVADILNNLATSNHIFDLTDGDISLHEVIEQVIMVIGKSDLLITSYTISDEAARVLFSMNESGMVGNISMLLDKSVHQHKSDLLYFLSKFCHDIFITDIHAKIIVFRNKNYFFSLITSANLSDNDKIESFLFINDPVTVFRIYTQITSLMTDSINIKTLYELYR